MISERQRRGRNGRSAAERLWARTLRPAPDECWIWQGSKTPQGYGLIHAGLGDRRMRPTHRVAYEDLVGPIPDGLELDHLCRNPSCVNPAHLEPVTKIENMRRGNSFTTANALKTHCLRGHEFTEENTTVKSDGRRECRECMRMHRRNWQARRFGPSEAT